MRDSGSEQDRKPSAGPAGETAAAQITARLRTGTWRAGLPWAGLPWAGLPQTGAQWAGGTPGTWARGATVTAVGSSGLTRTFTLDIGNLTGGTGVVAAGGQRLTGLLVSSARVMAGEETGGPLVNLSGQAIGINVAGMGSGLHHTGFAVPINEALAVAQQILAAHSH
jgi:hypothetical protein